MRTKLLSLAISFLFLTTASSQIDSITLSKLKLNFVVPDIPAFKALGTEPSNLLRPSTPQALAVSFSEFYNDRKFLVPEGVALEITPAILLNAKKGLYQLQHYAKNAVLNSFRVSLGTSSDTTYSPIGKNLALGARINIINNGDPINDPAFLQKLAKKLGEFRSSERQCRENFAQANIDSVKKWADDNNPAHTNIELVIDWDFFLNEKITKDSKWNEKYTDFRTSCDGSFDAWLEQEKEAYKKKNWNATRLDLAVSFLTSSRDSLAKNLKFNKAEFWLTWAQRSGQYGQLLVGLNSQFSKNLKDTVEATSDNLYFNVAIPVRYLFGTNRVKGFGEAQYSYNSYQKVNKFLLSLGSELNIIDGFWVNMYAGFDYDSSQGEAAFVANMNIKITLPEKFKLF